MVVTTPLQRFTKYGSAIALLLVLVIAAAGVSADFRTSNAALRAAALKPSAKLCRHSFNHMFLFIFLPLQIYAMVCRHLLTNVLIV
jgi:hypothetical protein